MGDPMNSDAKKTLYLAIAATVALGLLMLATQYVQQRQFWKEIDGYRTDNKFAEFLEWERERKESTGDSDE